MTREQIIAQALDAANRAKALATQAESASHSIERHHQTERFAAAGATWADVARSYAAVAELLTETETETVDV